MTSIPKRLALWLLSFTALLGPALAARGDSTPFLPTPAPQRDSSDEFGPDLEALVMARAEKDPIIAAKLHEISVWKAKIEEIREKVRPEKFKQASRWHQALLAKAEKALQQRRELLLPKLREELRLQRFPEHDRDAPK